MNQDDERDHEEEAANAALAHEQKMAELLDRLDPVNEEPDEIVETEEDKKPDFEVVHADGDNTYSYCNAAEKHAVNNQGHSMTVICTYNGEIGEVQLRITCNGTEGAFMTGCRDCVFWEDMIIS